MRLFRIYAEGNFIEAGTDTLFLQTGETKYGKPILDRVLAPDTSLADATKCVLVSFDSTMRSNLSVGMPIDLICYERDSLHVGGGDSTRAIPYFTAVGRLGAKAPARYSAGCPSFVGDENSPKIKSENSSSDSETTMKISVGFEMIFECQSPPR